MNVDPRHYAVVLRGTWHLVTTRKVGDRDVRELWQTRPAGYRPPNSETGLPVMVALGKTWDWVSRMH